LFLFNDITNPSGQQFIMKMVILKEALIYIFFFFIMIF